MNGKPLAPELGFEGALFGLNLISKFSRNGVIGFRGGVLLDV